MIRTKLKFAAIFTGAMICAGGATLVIARGVSDSSTTSTVGASLSNGVSVELIGIGQNPSGNKPWWTADGSPLKQAPYYKMGGSTYPQSPAEVAREFAVRIHSQITGSPEPASVKWDVIGADGWAGSTGESKSGQQVPDIEAHSISAPNSIGGVVLHCKVAAGSYVPRIASPGSSASSMSMGNEAFIVGVASEAQGATSIPVVYAGGKDFELRVIATDAAGKQYVGSPGSGGSAGDAVLTTYRFDRLPLKQIKEFQLQSRPYDQWIDIRNICVDPAHPTKPVVVTSDKPNDSSL